VSIKFVEKEERQQKGGYEYITEHKTRSARNTARKTGREERGVSLEIWFPNIGVLSDSVQIQGFINIICDFVTVFCHFLFTCILYHIVVLHI